MVTAGLLGRKTGRGFYTYERAGLPGRRADEHDPGRTGGRRAAAGVRAGRARSASSAPGTMATGIVEVFAKAGYDVVYVARGEEKVDRACAHAIERVAGQGGRCAAS